MKKRGLDKDLVLLLITTLIMLCTWVGLEVYRSYAHSPVEPEVEKHLKMLDPTLDKTVFSLLSEEEKNSDEKP